MLALTLLAYWPSRQSQFVFEDWSASPSRAPFSAYAIPRGLTAYSMQMQQGQTPYAHKLMSLAIHLVNGLLVFALTQSLWLLAIVWLHPMFSESASYISARADLLLVTATLLTWCWLRITTGWSAVIGATVGTALALGAKESAVTLPALVLLWLWASHRLSRPWIIYALGCGTAMAYQSWRMVAHLSSWTAEPSVTGLAFAAKQAGAFWRLISLIVPIGLTPVHAWEWMPSSLAWIALMGLGALACIGMACAFTGKRWLAVAALWPLIALSPRFVIPLPTLLTEHHLPYACIGSLLAFNRHFSGASA